MNFEQKVMAMKALGELTLQMNKPGVWYVSIRGVERVEDSVLSSGFNPGRTPEQAIDAEWGWLTESPKFKTIRISNGDRVTWNGFMWAKVEASALRPETKWSTSGPVVRGKEGF